MAESKCFSIISKGKKIILNSSTILYAMKVEKLLEIHTAGGKIHRSRMTLGELEKNLGENDFIKIHRGCVVSLMAIHDITDTINLINGDSLIYTLQKKKQIMEQFMEWQKAVVRNFDSTGIPTTLDEYRKYYSGFDALPIAFTDIEMVYDEKKRAVDWIFRYANSALAELEKVPLERLVGSSFGSLFSNMDEKWLRSYERSVRYQETLELMDYSPEIDTYLKVICFPTFAGHCGCILFDITELKLMQGDSQTALRLYLEKRQRYEDDSE